MAEIDKLEINIAAEASQAEAHIIRLANQMDRLGNVSRSSAVSMQKFADALKSIKIDSANDISASIDKLVNTVNKVNSINVEAKANDIQQKLNAIVNAVNGFQINDSFESNVQNIVNAIGGINNIQLPNVDDLQKNFSVIVSAFSIINGLRITLDVEDTKAKTDAISQIANSLNVDSKFESKIKSFISSIESLNKLNDIDFSGINFALNAISRMPEISNIISSIKIDSTFNENVKGIVSAFNSFGKIKGIETFYGNIEKLRDAIALLNSIEFGNGFQNLTAAASQFNSAVHSAMALDVGENFLSNIKKIANAAETLSSVDFSKMREMNEVLGNLPENVRVSFGASSNEIKEINELIEITAGSLESVTQQLITLNSLKRASEERKKSSQKQNEQEKNEPQFTYEWQNSETQKIIEASNSIVDQRHKLQQLIDAYHNMHLQVPPELEALADELKGVNESIQPNFSWNTDAVRAITERAAELSREQKEIQRVISSYERLGETIPDNIQQRAFEIDERTTRYDWGNAELTETVDRANALAQEQRAINAVINAYHILGEQVPPEIRQIAHELNAIANVRMDYSWSNEAVRSTIERANELQAEQREIARVIHAYEELGQQAPDDVLQRARELRQPTEYQPNFAWRSEEIRLVQESAQHHERERAEIQRVIEAYREMGRAVPISLRRIQHNLENVHTPYTEFQKLSSAVAKASVSIAKFSLKAVMAPITSVAGTIGKAVTKLSEFWRAMKRIAMYRALRTAIKAITDGFNEGRKNLYQYSLIVGTEFAPSMDKAATSALYLKNSIGAATAPLTNYFVPILDSLVDKLVEVINGFNEMTAVLTGADTWTRAIKYPTQWEEAADDATSAAKKLKSTMLGFDELNVIEPPTNSAKDKGFSADDYAKMFEEVKTNFELPETLAEIVQPVKIVWDNYGLGVIEEIKHTWEDIKGLIDSVAESFKTVWLNGTGQETLTLILNIARDVVGTFGDLADKIREAWEEDDKGTSIVQHTWNIVNNVLAFVRDIWQSIRQWVNGLDLNPLLEGIRDVLSAIDTATSPTSALYTILKDIWEKIVLPVGKWLIEDGIPAVLKFSAALIKLSNSVGKNLKPVLDWLYDNILKPAGQFIGSTLTTTLNILTDFVNVLDKLENADFDFSDSLLINFGYDIGTGKENFWDLWASGAEEIFSGKNGYFEELGTKIYDLFHPESPQIDTSGLVTSIDTVTEKFAEFKEAWQLGFDTIVQKWNEYKDNWTIGMESIASVWNGFKEALQIGWNSISEKWNGFKESWADGVDTIKTAWESFRATWADGVDTIKKKFSDLKNNVTQKWNNIKTSLSGGWDSIKNKVSDFTGYFVDGYEKMKTAINEKWENLKSLLSGGWNALKEKIDDFARKWNDGFETIKTYVTNGIQAAKDAVTNSAAWKFFEGIGGAVAGFFDKGLAGIPAKIGATLTNVLNAFQQTDFWKFFSGIGSAIYGFFDTGFTDVSKAVGQFVKDISDKIKNLWDDGNGGGIKGWVTGIASSIASSVKGIFDTLFSGDFLNSILDQIETIINFFIEGLNGLIRLAREFAGGFLSNIPAYDIPEFHFPGRYAKGGFPPKGQLFIANESGAEMVGKFGSQTAVANNQQIVDGVSQGVYSAVIAAFNQLNGSDSNDKTINLNVFLDGRQITAAVEETQRNKGISIMRGVSYT